MFAFELVLFAHCALGRCCGVPVGCGCCFAHGVLASRGVVGGDWIPWDGIRSSGLCAGRSFASQGGRSECRCSLVHGVRVYQVDGFRPRSSALVGGDPVGWGDYHLCGPGGRS